MSRQVILFVVPGMQENEAAIQILRSLPDTDLLIEQCGASMRDLYVCPFLRDEDNRPHYGLSGVERYVSIAREHGRNGKHRQS